MTAQTIGTAVARKTDQPSPSALIGNNRADLAQVMPSHMRADTWVRIAQGVVRRDRKLAEAAHNSPQSLMVALMEAARLGLEPGTEQYYLTPRKNRGKLEILGITGYQGLIELMYRSGAVASVVVEVVRENDTFRWAPGRMVKPEHEADWFATEAERGPLRGVYAYAEMTNGSTSKVVVLNRDHIARAKEAAQGADSQYSPWNTNEEAMWLKTAARRLSKWVPTSTEDRRIVQGTAERADRPSLNAADIEPDPLDITEHTTETDDAIDAELVEDGGQQ
ncbi:recombination protein RecT [Saccharopolyspora antimicrobica]|uniref:Recombination protein RecT n=1 Tax=Saccharopolyspora antimicrobica TaxID=455193 RepID=A0A1I5KKY7_9PSEU|nr:recombinase RecT [Saccharopolyspora antimicrobica]RKT85630.1 recombination protein RecT [Saccharopolyspora antimicrobica]SFO85770.1 recombination protein RecT [Saccharopolyspora antimicrobica]